MQFLGICQIAKRNNEALIITNIYMERAALNVAVIIHGNEKLKYQFRA